jgi:aminoglycoside 6'-N-acetyltransferase I
VSAELRLTIRRAGPGDVRGWLELRHALWPEASAQDLEPDLTEYLSQPDTHAALIAVRPDGSLAGFAEIRLRSFADECLTSPVAYLEGWYVAPDSRRQGVGGGLVRAGEAWARERGCRELGSDTHIENVISRQAHRALGFEEGRPVVHFRKAL